MIHVDNLAGRLEVNFEGRCYCCIPTLNEEDAIGLVLYEVLGEGYENVVVVDGYSTDNTVQIAHEHGVSVVVQHGFGKTGAILTVLDYYVRTPYLLVIGSDCTYSAKDI